MWKQVPFSAEAFKNGTADIRSQMVVDIIRNEKLMGLSTNQVLNLLGENTGDYYYSESNLTYRLTEKRTADWILTLIPDEDGKIIHAFIRKSCCSISQKALHWMMEKSEPLFKKLLQ